MPPSATPTIHIEKKDRLAVEKAAEALRTRLLQENLEKKAVSTTDAVTLSGLPLDMAESALFLLASVYTARIEVYKHKESEQKTELRVIFYNLRTKIGESEQKQSVFWQKAKEKLQDWAQRALYFIQDQIIFIFTPIFILLLDANIAGLGIWLTLDFPMAGFFRIVIGMPFILFVGLFGVFAALSLVLLVLSLTGVFLAAVGVVFTIAVPVILIYDKNITAAIITAIVAAISLFFGIPWAKQGIDSIREMSDRDSKDAMFAELWDVAKRYLFGVQQKNTKTSEPTQDDLADERRLTLLLYQQKGILHARDLVRLFGWNLSQIDAHISRLLVDYGGEIQVTDAGTLVYVFDSWYKNYQKSDEMHKRLYDAQKSGILQPLWEQEHIKNKISANYPFWDLEKAQISIITGVLVAGMAGLVSLHFFIPNTSVFFPDYQHMFRRGLGSIKGPDLLYILGIYPYLFIFTVVCMRFLWWKYTTKQRQKARAWYEWLQNIVNHPEGDWYSHQYADPAYILAFGGEIDETKGSKNDGAGQCYFVKYPSLSVMD